MRVCAVVSVLYHISVIGITQLQQRGDRGDGDLPVVAHCCLLEAQYDVKTKISTILKEIFEGEY